MSESGHEVYLVGSVPMADEAEVFRNVSQALGTRLKQIPDGETGMRLDWITWLEPLFSENPAFEVSDEVFAVHDAANTYHRYRLKPGLTADQVVFDNLLWGDAAIRSYQTFRQLRDAGIIPAGTRFQVDLVPAHSVIWLFVVESQQAALDPVFNAAVEREIGKIAAAIPHRDLAIQLDVASAVFARLQRGVASPYGGGKEEMQARFTGILTGLAMAVPPDVDLLFHFCYGDSNHRHVIEPTDMGDMVEMANRLMAVITRPIQLFHMPVPRNRDDDAYFAPLARLHMNPETKVCLGLIHYTDGLAGTRRRMVTASRHIRDYAIATECGFGRRDPKTIPALLKLHAEAAAV